jgi:hypothetical protein
MRTMRIYREYLPWDEELSDDGRNGYKVTIPDRATIIRVESQPGGGVWVTWTLEP